MINTDTVRSGSRPCAFVECIGLPAQPKHTQTSETLAPNAKDNFRYNSDPLLPIGSLRELPNCSMSDLVNYGLKHSPAPNPYGRVRTTLPQAAMAVSAGPADADYRKPHFPK